MPLHRSSLVPDSKALSPQLSLECSTVIPLPALTGASVSSAINDGCRHVGVMTQLGFKMTASAFETCRIENHLSAAYDVVCDPIVIPWARNPIAH